MAIEETITVSAGGAVGEIASVGDAFEEAAAKAAAAKREFAGAFDFKAGGAGGAAGLDSMAAQAEAAAGRVTAAMDKIAQAQARLGDSGAGAGASGAAGVERLADSVTAAAGQVSAGADKIKASLGEIGESGASLGRAGAELKGLGDAGDAAAAGLGGAADSVKGVGAGADTSAAQLAALRAEMRETAAENDRTMAASAVASRDANVKIASGQRLNTMAMRDASAEAVAAQKAQSAAAKQAAADAEASSGKHSMLLLGIAGAAAYGLDKAAQLQTAVTKLYTSAGESQKNLPLISQGIIGLSGQTDTSQAQLGQGAYTVESAGFHGGDALAVLGSAAEGAKAEGADLGVTSNALTTVLNDYFGGPQRSAKTEQRQATQAMNEIIASVGQGKMTLQDLSGALPAVLPTAKTAGLSLPQVLGAMSTMTAQGTSAQESAQQIRHTITALQKPSNVQAAEMQMLGINPVQLSKDLGKQGLTGTIGEVDAAIKAHSKNGMVMVDTMNQSKLAVQSAREEIAAMPPAIRGVAQAYLSGSINAKAFNADVRQGPFSARDANLLKQFEGTAGTALGFSSLIKSGGGNRQTIAAALNAAMGGQVGQQVAQQVGGEHLKDFGENVRKIGDTARHTGDSIRGWDQVQQTLNFKLGSFTKQLEAVATQAGQIALPAATNIMGGLGDVTGFLASNPEVTKPLLAAGGILGAGYAYQRIQQPVTTAIQGVGKIAETLHIPGLDKLSGVGKTAGAAGLDGAAGKLGAAGGDLSAAAGDLSAAAGKLGAGEGLPPGKPGEPVPAGTAAEESAAAGTTAEEEAAGGLGLGALAKGGLGALARGGIGLLIADMVARSLVGAVPKASPQALRQAGTGGTLGDFDRKIYGNDVNNLVADINKNFSAPARNAIKHGVDDVLHGFTGSLGPQGPIGAYPEYGRFGIGRAPQMAPPAAPTSLPSYRTGAGLRGTVTRAETVKAPVNVDLSSVESAKTKAMNALQGIGQAHLKPVKIPAPDMSALEGAKGKASSALNSITQALNTGASKPVKIPAPDTSAVAGAQGKVAGDMHGIVGAMQSAAGPARAAGAAVSEGLAAGITSEGAAAVAAAQSIASQVADAMRSALQTHSPSRVTEIIGVDTTAGLAKGISSGESKAKVKKAAVDITKAAAQSLATGLLGGQSAVDAVTTALGGTVKGSDIQSIEATVAKLKDDLTKALKAGDIKKPEDSALTKMLTADQKKLETLAGKRATLEQEISNAQQIATSAVSGASILNAGQAQPTESITAQGADTTVQGMQYQAQQQAQFAQQLAQLKSQGLNSTSLSQIAQGGASAGLPVTEGLVGDKGAISQVNQAQQQINKAAGQIGTIGGVAGFNSGKQIANQTAAGLKSQLSQVENEMKSIGKGMVGAVEAAVSGKGTAAAMKAAGVAAGAGFAAGIASETGAAAGAAKALAAAAEAAARSALKSRSPSLVFEEIGGTTPQGFAAGIMKGLPEVMMASSEMAKLAAASAARSSPLDSQHAGMMSPGFGGGGFGRQFAGGPPPTTHVTVNMTVMGSVSTHQDIVNSVRDTVLQHANNNWQSGWNLPYRGR